MSTKSLVSFSKFIVFSSFSAAAFCLALYCILPEDILINDESLIILNTVRLTWRLDSLHTTILLALVINLCISYLTLYFYWLLKKKLEEEQKVEQEFLVDPLTGETKTYRV